MSYYDVTFHDAMLNLFHSARTAYAPCPSENACPADSEHSAIFQCIQGLPENGLRRIILTASGGAFRDWPVEKLQTVKVADALKHPNWSMGRKITVDSATLMNKGLEVIEAHYLFGVDYDNIDIVIHPQSIIHSMVETQDSSVLAQVSAVHNVQVWLIIRHCAD